MLSHTLLTYGVGPVEEASGSGVLGLVSRLCGLMLSKPRCGCCRFCYRCLFLASSINSFWISRRVVWRGLSFWPAHLFSLVSSILADSDLTILVDSPIRLVYPFVCFVYAG